MKQSVIHPPQRKISILRNEKTGLSHLLISAPVSSVAGFVTFVAVSPFTPGSVSVT